jgi:hypothetical protein
VYVVVLPGEAVTLAPVEELRDDGGVHVYVVPPEAVSVVDPPAQIVALFTLGVIEPPMVTVEVAIAVQPAAEVALTV